LHKIVPVLSPNFFTMIESLSYPENTSNIGGCHTFRFIEADKVAAIVINTLYNYVSSIDLKSDAAFHSGYASFRSLQFRERMRNNDSGYYFLTQISGFYPGLSPQVLNIFSAMQHHEFIVSVTDNNNQTHLAGTPRTPLKFTFDQTSGANPSQRNGFEFRFEGELLNPSPFFNINL
jgi:hypothetical protein